MGPASLPVRACTERLLRAVEKNSVVVAIGDAGSGKTTQIPQILWEAGYCEEGSMVVTQPRRLAAISAAKRVSWEMGVDLGLEVGYTVRFEDCASPRTKIKYVTDGVLLRECLADAELTQYSVIVLDEAHERTLNTDILFGILKSLVQNRKKSLKLLITSATLDGKKFSHYFMNCPILDIPGTCFPVEIIHSTENHLSNYVQGAVDVVLDVHLHQPPGDILLFLTGQAEILKAVCLLNEAVSNFPEGSCTDLQVLPLYAALPIEQQALVFTPPPEGCRRCVVATNIAETSITVVGVVYVVDPGTVKQKAYNPLTGMGSLEVVTISRVQAKQRAGRAGRTQKGVCYRLYTKAFYDKEMLDITLPEIQRSSLVSAVLYLKSLALKIDILKFDYLDSPEIAALEDALHQLFVLGAIDIDGKITSQGREMAHLPIEPSLARALLAAVEFGCLEQMITVAAMLSAEDIFPDRVGPPQSISRKTEEDDGESNKVVRDLANEGLGDHVLFLQIYEAWERERFSIGWCRAQGLNARAMKYAKDIRNQLSHMASELHKSSAGDERERLRNSGPKTKKRKRMRSIEACGWNAEDTTGCMALHNALRKAICIGFANRLAHRMAIHNGYRPLSTGAPLAQIHPSCASVTVDEDGLQPEWIVYHECIGLSRPFLRQVCPVDEKWVEPLLPRLRNVDLKRLSGGISQQNNDSSSHRTAPSEIGGADGGTVLGRRNDANAVAAARQRFLERKGAKQRK